jgi:hypothetical protein
MTENIPTLQQICRKVIDKTHLPVMLQDLPDNKVMDLHYSGELENEINEYKNNVTGGRYPTKNEPFVFGLGKLQDEPYIPDNASKERATKAKMFFKSNKPHGHLRITNIEKKGDQSEKIGLRFDDDFRLDAWFEFELDLDEVEKAIATYRENKKPRLENTE